MPIWPLPRKKPISAPKTTPNNRLMIIRMVPDPTEKMTPSNLVTNLMTPEINQKGKTAFYGS